MAPVLRQQLALLKADIAFFGKALDGEDVAVIEARAFGLALDLRLAVFGDADAVAFGNADLARAEYLEAVVLASTGRPARLPSCFCSNRPVIVLERLRPFRRA